MPPQTPLLTVDCVLFDPDGRVLLITRGNPPFQGALALPGGFVDVGETVEAACRRELAEEAGVEAADLVLVGVYSDPGRDPRFHTATVAYAGRVGRVALRAGDDAATAEWVADWRDRPFAFDHRQIVEDAATKLGI